MFDSSSKLEKRIQDLMKNFDETNQVASKKISIGSSHEKICIIYNSEMINNDLINNNILNPLMIHANKEEFNKIKDMPQYIMENYITLGDVKIEDQLGNALYRINQGYTAIIFGRDERILLINTFNKKYKDVSPATMETSIRGPKESFTESLDTNLAIMVRRIKDDNLRVENFVVGARSKTKIDILYLKDIADKSIVNDLKRRMEVIDVDYVKSTGTLQQYIENNTYTIFPQLFTTERPDIIEANVMEGRVAILMEGAPQGMVAPSVFAEFFQSGEDYNDRFIVASFIRILRILAMFVVLSITPIYLTLIKFNVEVLPEKFIGPIVQSRTGIALSPVMEIISMEIIIEFLREGGIRLPSKVAQTISVVGGIIIGDAAIKSHLVSSTTLLIVGISTVATFLIPSYEMASAIRILKYPILLVTNAIGIIGISISWFYIIVNLCSIDSFGVPYLSVHKSDLKDLLIRSPLWKMNKRPKTIPNKNPIRQTDFRSLFRRKRKDGRK